LCSESTPQKSITTDDKVAFLASTAAYPAASAEVEVVETHLSWVFLTERYAYKLKKPIRVRNIDYRTIESRHRNCIREVQLNQRLAPAVYLGVVGLTIDQDGTFHLGGTGRTVDWLVKMRRLPADRTLEHGIVAGTLQQEDIDAIAHRLSRFYRDAPRIPVSTEHYWESLKTQTAEIHRQLLHPVYVLDAEAVEQISATLLGFLDRARDLFTARAQSGHIVEGHGDLRPEHIYLCDEPIIVDCLEFDPQLRILDPASELAFLAMECERLDAPHVGDRLFDVYRNETGDNPPHSLIVFHKGMHAYIRARIAISHFDDREVRQPEKWRKRTERYLCLARKYTRSLHSDSPGFMSFPG